MAKKSFSNDLLGDLHSESLTIDLTPNFNEPIDLSPLDSTEQAQLIACEKIIEKGYNTFIEVGNALFEIRNNKLYREKHSTFEEYCKGKWQIKRQRAYELMEAATIVNGLTEISDKNNSEDPNSITLNIRESHAAALAKIPQELRNDVWQKAVEKQQTSGKAITAKFIQTVYSEQQKTEKTENSEEIKQREEHDLLVKKIREKVRHAKLEYITVEVKGIFIIENDLEEIWQKLRNDYTKISENDKITLSVEQAVILGLIGKV